MSIPADNWLARLVQESGPTLVRFLSRRMASRSEAEDLAQEVYLRLLRIEDTGAIRDPRSYALRVAANVVYEWRMSARNRFAHIEPVESEDEQLDPCRQVLRGEQMKLLSRALDRLSPMQRAVLLLHRRDGLTYQEIAKHVQLSVQMVNKHLAKGLAICKDSLADSEARE